MNLKKQDIKETYNDLEECNFNCSFEFVAKKFMNKHLSCNAHALNTSDLISEYNRLVNKSYIGNEDQFYKYIAKEYLSLDKEPKIVLLDLFIKASKDIAAIDKQISFIESQKKIINDKRSNKTKNGEDNYYEKQLDFYKKRNELAKSEIINFLSGGKIFYITFWKCNCDSIYSSFTRYYRPYFYSENNPYYDVKSLSELSNKFLDLPVGSHEFITNIYHSDIYQFYRIADGYIENNKLPEIEEIVIKNHILNKRKDVISKMLNHFKSGDFISFVSMMPLQIEGIFHDICLEIGVDEFSLNGESLNKKIERINDSCDSHHFITFEYYAFKFPIIRNKVAHGQRIDGDIQQASIMLMLDFFPVCDLAKSDFILSNKSIGILRKIEKTMKNDEKFDLLLELFPIIKKITPEIISFYEIEDLFDKTKNLYCCSDFWGYMEENLHKEINRMPIMPSNAKGCEIYKVGQEIEMFFRKEENEHGKRFLKSSFKNALAKTEKLRNSVNSILSSLKQNNS